MCSRWSAGQLIVLLPPQHNILRVKGHFQPLTWSWCLPPVVEKWHFRSWWEYYIRSRSLSKLAVNLKTYEMQNMTKPSSFFKMYISWDTILQQWWHFLSQQDDMAFKSQRPTADLPKDVAFITSQFEPGLTFLSNPSYLFVLCSTLVPLYLSVNSLTARGLLLFTQGLRLYRKVDS